MKLKALLLSLLMLANLGSLKADYVEIGPTPRTWDNLPTNTNYRASLSQQIYTADELREFTTIKSIGFYNEGDVRTRKLDIYLVYTDQTAFEENIESDMGGESNDWIPFTDQYKVFSGNVTFLSNAWTTINLTKTFDFDYDDGTTHVALITVDHTGSYQAEVPFRAFYTDEDQSIYTYSDTEQFYASDLNDYVGNIQNVKNIIQINGQEIKQKSTWLPTTAYYKYAFTEQIYGSYELGGAMDISSISYFNLGQEQTRRLDVYLKQTSKLNFDGDQDWEPVSEQDLVFSGEVTFKAGEWTAIPFNDEFNYTGGGQNLLVAIDDNTGEYTKPTPFLTYYSSSQGLHASSDEGNFDPFNTGDPYYGMVSGTKNIIRFNEVNIFAEPTNIQAIDVSETSATITWESDGNAWNLQYQVDGASEWTVINDLTERKYTITGLQPGTKYTVFVQRNNGNGNVGYWGTIQFTTETFNAPTGLEVLSVTPYSAILTWELQGEATGYQIAVNDDTNIADADRVPFILTGLTPGTDYNIAVRSVIDAEQGLYSPWSTDIEFSTPEANPAPTDIAVTTTPTSATITWNGTGDAYEVWYRKGLSEGFEDGIPAGWKLVDADGDGENWYNWSTTNIDGNGNFYVFGNRCVTSASWDSSGPLTPDNWLISPIMDLQGTMSVWLRGVDPAYPSENFTILLSTTGNETSDFTTTLVPETKTFGWYVKYVADLSAYEGQQGYIAIRHFNVTDQYRIALDEFSVGGEWQLIETKEKAVTIEGLTPGTKYAFNVVSLAQGQEDSSSGGRTFSTLDNNPAPFDIAVKPYATTADLSWTGYSDGYVIEYWEWQESLTMIEDFESGDLATNGWTVLTEKEHPSDSEGWYISDFGDFVRNGSNGIVARSWAIDTAYDADNWLISPRVDLGGFLRYWEKTQPEFSDKYEVLLSTTGTQKSDFTTTLRAMAPGNTNAGWDQVEIDLTAYKGQQGYIAFHHVDKDANYLALDDISITQEILGEKQMVGAFTTQKTITGLKPDTDYRVVITGAKTSGETASSKAIYFTTGSNDPTDLVFDNTGYCQSDITTYNDTYANVTIQNLTLPAGQWMPLCLPFDVEVENSLLAQADVRTIEDVNIIDNHYVISCITPRETMKAGLPYIVRWNGSADLVNPTFKGVKISSWTQQLSAGNTDFLPATYDYETLVTHMPDYYQADGTSLFPILAGSVRNAFEPYFRVPDGYDIPIVLDMGDGSIPTGIASHFGQAEEEILYNVSGQRVAGNYKGIVVTKGKKMQRK